MSGLVHAAKYKRLPTHSVKGNLDLSSSVPCLDKHIPVLVGVLLDLESLIPYLDTMSDVSLLAKA